MLDGIGRTTDTAMASNVAVVCNYGDVCKGSAESMRGEGASVKVTEIDLICAPQAEMDENEVCLLEEEVDTSVVLITITGNDDVIRTKHMRKMKNMAIIGNIGHFNN